MNGIRAIEIVPQREQERQTLAELSGRMLLTRQILQFYRTLRHYFNLPYFTRNIILSQEERLRGYENYRQIRIGSGPFVADLDSSFSSSLLSLMHNRFL